MNGGTQQMTREEFLLALKTMDEALGRRYFSGFDQDNMYEYPENYIWNMKEIIAMARQFPDTLKTNAKNGEDAGLLVQTALAVGRYMEDMCESRGVGDRFREELHAMTAIWGGRILKAADLGLGFAEGNGFDPETLPAGIRRRPLYALGIWKECRFAGKQDLTGMNGRAVNRIADYIAGYYASRAPAADVAWFLFHAQNADDSAAEIRAAVESGLDGQRRANVESTMVAIKGAVSAARTIAESGLMKDVDLDPDRDGCWLFADYADVARTAVFLVAKDNLERDEGLTQAQRDSLATLAVFLTETAAARYPASEGLKSAAAQEVTQIRLNHAAATLAKTDAGFSDLPDMVDAARSSQDISYERVLDIAAKLESAENNPGIALLKEWVRRQIVSDFVVHPGWRVVKLEGKMAEQKPGTALHALFQGYLDGIDEKSRLWYQKRLEQKGTPVPAIREPERSAKWVRAVRAMKTCDPFGEEGAFLREIEHALDKIRRTRRTDANAESKAVEDNPWFLLRAAALRARIENDPAMAPVMDYLNCYIDAAGMRDSWNAETETFREICEGLEDRDAFLSAIGRIEASAAYSEENPGTPAARWLTRYAEEAGLSRHFDRISSPNIPQASGALVMEQCPGSARILYRALSENNIRLAAIFLRNMAADLKHSCHDRTHVIGAARAVEQYFYETWGRDNLETERAWVGNAEKAADKFDINDNTLLRIYRTPEEARPFHAAVFLKKLETALNGPDKEASAAAAEVEPYMIRVLNAMPQEWQDEMRAWAPALDSYMENAQTLASLMKGYAESDRALILNEVAHLGSMRKNVILAEEAQKEGVSAEDFRKLDELKSLCARFTEAAGGSRPDPERDTSVRAAVAIGRVARARLPELAEVQKALESYLMQTPWGGVWRAGNAFDDSADPLYCEKLYMALTDALAAGGHSERLASSLAVCRDDMERVMTEHDREIIAGMREQAALSRTKAAPKRGPAP